MGEKPILYLHVGMGKTGTTSIQEALRRSEEKLAEAGVVNLNGLGKGYRKLAEASLLQFEDEQEQRRIAKVLARRLRLCSRRGLSSGIYSNEGLFAAAKRLEPFVDELKKSVDVRAIVFVRHPADWLPSAYVQWGIKHKLNEGRVLSFEEHASQFIKKYAAIDIWHSYLGEDVMVLPYTPGVNAVEQFSDVIGVELDGSTDRLQSRPEDAELIMRAVFNDRLEVAALPNLFDEVIVDTRVQTIPSRHAFLRDIYASDRVSELIEEHKAVFDGFEEHHDLNIMTLPRGSKRKKPSLRDLDGRLLDYMLYMSVRHGSRTHLHRHSIDSMKNEIARLRDDVRKKSDELADNTSEARRRLLKIEEMLSDSYRRSTKIETALNELQIRQELVQRTSISMKARKVLGFITRPLRSVRQRA